MRTAVLLYGFTRNFDELVASYRSALPNNTDVFVYTYDMYYPTPSQNNMIIPPNFKRLDMYWFRNTFTTQLKGYKAEKYDDLYFKAQLTALGIPQVNAINQPTFQVMAELDAIKKVIGLKMAYETANSFSYDQVIMMGMNLSFTSTSINSSGNIVINPIGNISVLSKFNIPAILNGIYNPLYEGFDEGGNRVALQYPIYGTDLLFNQHIIVGNSLTINGLADIYGLLQSYSIAGKVLAIPTLIGTYLIDNSVPFQTYDLISYKMYRPQLYQKFM
jgi:hypothetical protein